MNGEFPDFTHRLVMPDYGLPLIGTLMAKQGYDVRVFIEHVQPPSWEAIRQSDLVCFSTLNAGADKVSINTAAVKDPRLIELAARNFGSQCIVLAIDAKLDDGNWLVYLNGGRVATELNAIQWAKQGTELGAGEILLTSMNADGTKTGFEIDLTRRISETVSVPVIASGGAGTTAHFLDIFTTGKADAALAASIFHFREIEIAQLKTFLKGHDLPIRI